MGRYQPSYGTGGRQEATEPAPSTWPYDDGGEDEAAVLPIDTAETPSRRRARHESAPPDPVVKVASLVATTVEQQRQLTEALHDTLALMKESIDAAATREPPRTEWKRLRTIRDDRGFITDIERIE